MKDFKIKMASSGVLISLLLFIFTPTNASALKINCAGIIFKNKYYAKKLLVGNLRSPYNLLYHSPSGLLFFSHTVDGFGGVDFKISACHLSNKRCFDVNDVRGGYALALDRENNNTIYMGGHYGIYKFNFDTMKAEYVMGKLASIWGLFIRNHIYSIHYPEQKLYYTEGKKFIPVDIINTEVYNFYIGENGNIYWTDKKLLYKLGKHDFVLPNANVNFQVISNKLTIRQISENIAGDVFFCANDGIYSESSDGVLFKQASIENAFGLTFDGNNYPIFSNMHNIYRLKESSVSNQCIEALRVYKEGEEPELFLSPPGEVYDYLP